MYAFEEDTFRVITTFITSSAQDIVEGKLKNNVWVKIKVKVEYDRDADILYIKLKDSKIVDTRMLGEDVYVDVDMDDNFVGIEIWKASQNAILPISREIAQEVKTVLEKCA